jgi:hypothetical protein
MAVHAPELPDQQEPRLDPGGIIGGMPPESLIARHDRRGVQAADRGAEHQHEEEEGAATHALTLGDT